MSLRNLIATATSLIDLVAEQAGEAGRHFLTQLESSIGDSEQITGRLRLAEISATSMSKIITDSVAELTGRLRSIEEIHFDVQMIATNTRLLGQRNGSSGKAVSVVASEVDLLATELGRITRNVANIIGKLAQTSLTAPDDDNQGNYDIGAALTGALEVIRHACLQPDKVALEGGDDAQQFAMLIDRMTGEIAQELETGPAIEVVAAMLGEGLPLPAVEDDIAIEHVRTCLLEIAPLYTMAAEREVHSRFLLPGMEVAAVEEEEDDDDDGLF